MSILAITIISIVVSVINFVIFLLFIVFNRNIRGLTKVRRYIESRMEQVEQYVEDRVSTVKDYGADLSANMESGNALLERLIAEQNNVKTKSKDLEQIGLSVDECESLLERLDTNLGQTRQQVEERQKHDAMIKKYYQKVQSLQVDLANMPKEIAQAREQFRRQNTADLERVANEVTSLFRHEIEATVKGAEQAEKSTKEAAKAFQLELSKNNSQYAREFEESIKAMGRNHEHNLARIKDELIAVIAGHEKKIAVTGGAVQKIIKANEARARKIENEGRATVDRLEQLIYSAREGSEKIASGIVDYRNQYKEITENIELQVIQSKNILVEGEKNLTEKAIEQIGCYVKNIEQQLDGKLENQIEMIRAGFANETAEIEQRIAVAQESMKEECRKGEAVRNDLADHWKKTGEVLGSMQLHLDERLSEQTRSMAANIDEHIDSCRVDCEKKIGERLVVIEKNIEQLASSLTDRQTALSNSIEKQTRNATDHIAVRLGAIQGDAESQLRKRSEELDKQADDLRSNVSLAIEQTKLQTEQAHEEYRELLEGIEQKQYEQAKDMIDRCNELWNKKIAATERSVEERTNRIADSIEKRSLYLYGKIDAGQNQFAAEIDLQTDRLRKTIEGQIVVVNRQIGEQLIVSERVVQKKVAALNSAEQEIEQRIQRMNSTVEEYSQEAIDRVQTGRAEMFAEIDRQFELLKQDIDGRVETFDHNISQTGHEMSERLEKLEQALQDHIAAFDTIGQGIEEQARKMNDTIEERSQVMLEKIDSEREGINAEIARQILAADQGANEQIAEMDRQFQERLAGCEQKLQKGAGAFDEQIAEMDRQFQERLAGCEQKLQKGAGAFDEIAEMDRQFQERLAGCEQKLQKGAGAFDEQIAEMDRQFQERLAGCEQKLQKGAGAFDEQIAEMDRQFQERLAGCEQKLQKDASAFDERVAEMDSQFQDRFAGCEQKLQKGAGAFDERVAEMDSQFQDRFAECEQKLQKAPALLMSGC